MSGHQDAQEMAILLAMPQFRRFLWRLSNAAGIFSSAYGTDGRDLAFREGRRSLGYEILRMADEGQPVPHPIALSTILAVLAEAEQSHIQEQAHAERRRRPANRYERERDGERDAGDGGV